MIEIINIIDYLYVWEKVIEFIIVLEMMKVFVMKVEEEVEIDLWGYMCLNEIIFCIVVNIFLKIYFIFIEIIQILGVSGLMVILIENMCYLLVKEDIMCYL